MRQQYVIILDTKEVEENNKTMDCEQIIQVTQNSKNWIDYLSALLVPTIAIFGLIIAFLQWYTNANRLRNEKFDRRYEKFEIINKFISSVNSYDGINHDEEMKFLSGTSGINFIFDRKIETYVNEIWHLAIDINTYKEELNGMTGHQRKEIAAKKHKAKNEFREKTEELESIFSKYLSLK